MPSLTQLEYAIAVDKHRHFGMAAKACAISQPTLSMQLQKLEDEVGVILFDRGHKPIITTPEGAKFLEQARHVLREHQKLLEIGRQNGKEVSGPFRLGIIPTIAGALLPLWIGTVAEKFPDIELYIEELTTDVLINRLSQDEIDGAILATPLHQSSLKEHPLYYEPFHVYLPEHHPLLKKSALTANDLDGSELWMLKDGNCFRTQVVEFCSLNKKKNKIGVYHNIHFQSGSLEALKNLVIRGHGKTLIPHLMTEFMSKNEIQTHVRSFKSPAPAREISLVYRRDHWKLAHLKAIEESIVSVIPPELKNAKGKDIVEFV